MQMIITGETIIRIQQQLHQVTEVMEFVINSEICIITYINTLFKVNISCKFETISEFKKYICIGYNLLFLI